MRITKRVEESKRFLKESEAKGKQSYAKAILELYNDIIFLLFQENKNSVALSRTRLLYKSGLCSSTLTRYMKQLKNLGFITTKSAYHRNTVYTIDSDLFGIQLDGNQRPYKLVNDSSKLNPTKKYLQLDSVKKARKTNEIIQEQKNLYRKKTRKLKKSEKLLKKKELKQQEKKAKMPKVNTDLKDVIDKEGFPVYKYLLDKVIPPFYHPEDLTYEQKSQFTKTKAWNSYQDQRKFDTWSEHDVVESIQKAEIRKAYLRKNSGVIIKDNIGWLLSQKNFNFDYKNIFSCEQHSNTYTSVYVAKDIDLQYIPLNCHSAIRTEKQEALKEEEIIKKRIQDNATRDQIFAWIKVNGSQAFKLNDIPINKLKKAYDSVRSNQLVLPRDRLEFLEGELRKVGCDVY